MDNLTELAVADWYPVLRWACDCGRFVAEASIKSTDYRDDNYYFGIRTESEFHCSRCGLKQGIPRLIEVGAAPLTLRGHES
jgi:hypothetical protein